MRDLHVKSTLEDSIYSAYKKRPGPIHCRQCAAAGVKGGVAGTRSPWAYSFGGYLLLHLKRFDAAGKMNARTCSYPAELDMSGFMEEPIAVSN